MAAGNLSPEDKGQAAEAALRAHVYGLLSLVFMKEPSPVLIRSMKAPEILGALADLGISLDDEFMQGDEDEIVEALSLEYTRLFLGPGPHISPYQSVYDSEDEGAQLWGRKTQEIQRFMKRLGLEMDDAQMIPDHIAVELAIMQKLCEREAEAWAEEDAEAAMLSLQLENEFMTGHLNVWIDGFCDAALDAEPAPFYRDAVRLTKMYVASESTYICDCVEASGDSVRSK